MVAATAYHNNKLLPNLCFTSSNLTAVKGEHLATSFARTDSNNSSKSLTPFIASDGDGDGSADGGAGGGGLAGKSLTERRR